MNMFLISIANTLQGHYRKSHIIRKSDLKEHVNHSRCYSPDLLRQGYTTTWRVKVEKWTGHVRVLPSRSHDEEERQTQLRSRFTDEQVRVLLPGCCQGSLARPEIQEMLGIGKTLTVSRSPVKDRHPAGYLSISG